MTEKCVVDFRDFNVSFCFSVLLEFRFIECIPLRWNGSWCACTFCCHGFLFTFSYASSILWLLDRLQAKVAVWLQYILYKFPFIYNALVAMNKLFYILDNLINLCRNVVGFFFFYFQLHVFISCSSLLPLWEIIILPLLI